MGHQRRTVARVTSRCAPGQVRDGRETAGSAVRPSFDDPRYGILLGERGRGDEAVREHDCAVKSGMMKRSKGNYILQNQNERSEVN
jgi:hypothetical protein